MFRPKNIQLKKNIEQTKIASYYNSIVWFSILSRNQTETSEFIKKGDFVKVDTVGNPGEQEWTEVKDVIYTSMGSNFFTKIITISIIYICINCSSSYP